MNVVWFCVFKQKTAYEMRISDWSSDVCSADLVGGVADIASARHGNRAVSTEPIQRSAPRHDESTSYGIRADHAARRGGGRQMVQPNGGLRLRAEIGRASCRERVCAYV